ncbi:MAG: OmpA family protein [Desulfovibrionaceae bacterium]
MMKLKNIYLAFTMVFVFAVLAGCADPDIVVTPEPAPQEESLIEDPIAEEIVEPVIVEEIIIEEQQDYLAPDAQAILERRVYFGFDQYILTEKEQEILKEKITVLENNPSIRIQVAGYCDDRGTQEYNLALGERRALAVYNYFIQNGIDASRLETISYGKLFPAVEGQDSYAWALNRRAQFEIIQ